MTNNVDQSQESWQKIVETARNLRVELLIAVFALVLIAVGFFQLRSSSLTEEIVVIDEKEQKVSGEIVVDIAGAISAPGVFAMPANARLGEAIEKAGGLTRAADLDWIAKNLNLAVKLSDGAKIYIPKKGERSSNVLGSSNNQVSININSASMSQLESLSGIGPKTAQKIIDGRPYQSVDDLLSQKIVGAKTFEKIKNEISVY